LLRQPLILERMWAPVSNRYGPEKDRHCCCERSQDAYREEGRRALHRARPVKTPLTVTVEGRFAFKCDAERVLSSPRYTAVFAAPFSGLAIVSGTTEATGGVSTFFAAEVLRLTTLLFATFLNGGFAVLLPVTRFVDETVVFLATFFTEVFDPVATFFAALTFLATVFLATPFFATASLSAGAATSPIRNFVRSRTLAIQAGGRA